MATKKKKKSITFLVSTLLSFIGKGEKTWAQNGQKSVSCLNRPVGEGATHDERAPIPARFNAYFIYKIYIELYKGTFLNLLESTSK